MIFGEPINLWWLLIVMVLVCLEILLWMKRRQLIFRLFPGELSCSMFRQWDKNKSLLKHSLFILAIFFLIIALTRPQWGKKIEISSQKGIDIMIAIDVSKSMLAKDLSPNRLENAKTSLNLLLDELAGNCIGLVTFAGTSFVNCPLTTDIGAVKIFLKSIDTELIPNPGTDIGKAIKTCVTAFGKSHNSKVIILITDGEELTGSAIDAADFAAREGIRIFAVGIGTLDGALIPTANGFKKDYAGNVVLSRANPELLHTLAEKSKGRAFLITQEQTGLQRLISAVSSLPGQQLKHQTTYQYQNRFQIFLCLVVMLLATEMLITERKKV